MFTTMDVPELDVDLLIAQQAELQSMRDAGAWDTEYVIPNGPSSGAVDNPYVARA